jgi:molybdenum cofactor biosynthesis protein B
MSTEEHKKGAPEHLRLGIITMSSSRSMAEDKSGDWMSKHIKKERHELVCRVVVPDEMATIRKAVRDAIREFAPDVLLLTGGTGIGPKDVTIEAVQPMFRKELSAFASLFAALSFEQINSAALLSRATAGLVYNSAVFCLPGSLKACKLACKELIFPEISHIVKHIYE